MDRMMLKQRSRRRISQKQTKQVDKQTRQVDTKTRQVNKQTRQVDKQTLFSFLYFSPFLSLLLLGLGELTKSKVPCLFFFVKEKGEH